MTEADTDTEVAVKLRSAMLTDVGVVRDHNEDSAFVDESMRYFIVADGMGGHAAGEVASAMAVQGISKALDESTEVLDRYAQSPSEETRQAVAEVLEMAVREAHRSVFERGVSEPDKKGMGTTLDVLLITGNEAFVAHVGDSRTYLMRGDTAAQITTDHTMAQVLVFEGKLSPEEAAVSHYRTVLINALGVSAELGVEMAHLTLHQGDRFLLCSDGLHDYYPKESELFEVVMENEPEAALENLIESAKERGGHDNITGVIIDVLSAPDQQATSTVPIPVVSASADGVPQEVVAKDDTLPVSVPTPSKSEDEEETGPVSRREAELDEEALRRAAATTQEIPAVVSEESAAVLNEADFRSTLPIRKATPPKDDNEAG